MERLERAKEIISKLIELENKNPDKIVYVSGLIDGLILNSNSNGKGNASND